MFFCFIKLIFGNRYGAGVSSLARQGSTQWQFLFLFSLYLHTTSTPTTSYRVVCLRVELLLKTDIGFPRDVEVTLFTLANPGSSLHFNTHWLAPPVSALKNLREDVPVTSLT